MGKKLSAFEVKQWVIAQDLSTAKLEKMASQSSVKVLMKCGDYMRGFHDGAFHVLCTPKVESTEKTDNTTNGKINPCSRSGDCAHYRVTGKCLGSECGVYAPA